MAGVLTYCSKGCLGNLTKREQSQQLTGLQCFGWVSPKSPVEDKRYKSQLIGKHGREDRHFTFQGKNKWLHLHICPPISCDKNVSLVPPGRKYAQQGIVKPMVQPNQHETFQNHRHWMTCNKNFLSCLCQLNQNIVNNLQSSRPQTFLASGTSWKTIFPWIRAGAGDSLGMIQVFSIYRALYFYYYYISSTSDNQALDAGGWGLLLYSCHRRPG